MNNGAIIYNGPSLLDGKPVTAVVTGLRQSSKNPKTGEMLQSYILRSDVHPREAIRVGADSSICGACPHRGRLERLADGTLKNTGRTCYVNLLFGPGAIFKKIQRGEYPKIFPSELGSGRFIRIGSYGDPAAIPFDIWQSLLENAKGHTGYTHQWHRCDPRFKDIVMASVDSITEAQEAQSLGWRTFRVAFPKDIPRLPNEAICPASKEAGKKLTCAECLACHGTGPRGHIVIQAHGNDFLMKSINQRIGDRSHA